jgi:hypothetical protein
VTVKAAVSAKQVARLTAICTALPEVEVRAGQHHAYLVRRKTFAYHLNDHHGDGRLTFQCKAGPGVAGDLVAADPRRFFLPPYMKQHGWVAMWLDVPGVKIGWDEIESLVIDGYRLLAPKRLVAQL